MQNQLVASDLKSIGFEVDIMWMLPRPSFSKTAVKRAGKLLSDDIHYVEGQGVPQEVIEAFRVAHDWRAAHVYPMHIESGRLSRLAKPFGGAVSASRLKRMSSIRKKLQRSPITLERIQDLAGCRVILPDMASVRAFQAVYENKHGDRIKRVTDYVEAPKPSGYRSIHVIVNPRSTGTRSVHNSQRVEIQMRSQLQHVWATAGEAIGAMRGEDIKAGEGNKDWLRLLNLMSAEFSLLEGEAVSSSLPANKHDRIAELVRLEEKLNAVAVLSTFSVAANYQQNVNWEKTQYFLIALDASKGTLSIRPQRSFGNNPYDSYGDTSENTQTALVSVENVEALAVAYPNFFLDVKGFLARLSEMVGMEAPPPIRKQSKNLDFSFLNHDKFRR